MAAKARERRSGAGTPNGSSPISTFSSTVSQGNRAKLWNTMAMPSLGPASGRPRQRTSPDTGRASPATMRSRDDLPEPERPSSPRISLACRSRLMSSSTSRSAPDPLG